MNKYVLFSPVGSTDPVRNDYDGALLHIVRHYKPHKVYLYYTKEMQQKSKEIKKALLPFAVDIEEMYSDITDPSSYDVFVGVFDKILIKIQNENKDSRLLLNIASGTPQMKSALCLEVVTTYLNLTPIQVVTPVKKSNENLTHGGELSNNLDNLMEDGVYLSQNRCLEPDILSFRRGMVKRDTISLVEHFEYRAAAEKLRNNKHLFNEDVINLVEYADLRQNDNKDYCKSEWHKEFNYTENTHAKIACDYYCILDNKAQKGELSYFVLLLKPLAEHIAKNYIGKINDDDACEVLNKYYKEKKRQSYRQDKYNNKVAYNLEQYIAIMESKNKSKDVCKKFLKLNKEIIKRNELAHTLKRIPQLDTKNLLKIFREIIEITYGNEIKEKNFHLYKNINKRIIELL